MFSVLEENTFFFSLLTFYRRCSNTENKQVITGKSENEFGFVTCEVPSSTNAAEMGIKSNLVVLYNLPDTEHWAASLLFFLGRSARVPLESIQRGIKFLKPKLSGCLFLITLIIKS